MSVLSYTMTGKAALAADTFTPPARPPMSPSRLRGGLTGIKADTPTDEFLQAFCDSITREEWQAIAALPPVKRVTELIVTVLLLRALPAQIAPAAMRRHA